MHHFDFAGDFHSRYIANVDLSGILMTAFQILILASLAAVAGRFVKGRSLLVLALSVLVVFWLQPYQEPVNLMFWMPVLTLGLASLSWVVTASLEARRWRDNYPAVLVMVGVMVFVQLNRYFQVEQFFAVETPRLQWVGAVVILFGVVGVLLARVSPRKFLLVLTLFGLLGILLLVKVPSAWGMLLGAVTEFRGKEAGGISGFTWLGISYVSFRLMHTILDRIAGRLPAVTLGEYVNYVMFFPAFVAGPIDRVERFVRDLRQPVELDSDGWVYAGTRLFVGLFKKFVIAEPLAWITLSDALARDVQNHWYLWLTLYAYSLRLYFDFSGYTDIAIGLGRLLGIKLPENFEAPYFKPNLTQFWNSWHITLTQWFRAYFFNPFTRAMRGARRPLPMWLMILISQLATMVLIGLWHGVTSSYLAWGLWHGVGLFAHNRWSEFVRARGWVVSDSIVSWVGVFLTFQFVSLGWLFFLFPDAFIAVQMMLKLFGGS